MKYSYDDLIRDVIQLREEANAARQRLMEFLYDVKTDESKLSLLTDAGQTFDAFVEKVALVKLSEYQRWEAGFLRLGKDTDTARRIGMHAVGAVTRLVDESKVPKYLDAVDAWVEEKRGATPSPETAKRLVCQVDPRAEVPAAVKARTEKQRLKAELSRAKAEVKKLRAENRSLKKKIERLQSKGKSASKRGGSRKPSQNAAQSLASQG